MKLKKYLPILEWLPNYSKYFFKNDLVAGFTVGIMLVPQGMAYALLAGVPPIYGLYSSLIPLILYALLGTSSHLSIGPVAVSALLVLAGISQVAVPGSPEYISLVILTGFLIGLVQLFASFIRLGFLVNFLSHPVLAGFTSAAAIIIAVSQLKYLLGFPIPQFSDIVDRMYFAFQHIHQIHFPTFFLCLGGILLIGGLKKVNKAIPGALLAVILSIILVKIFHLEEQGIEIVKEVPKGLPPFQLPEWTLANIRLVLPTVLTVTLIGIVESISIAKVWETKHNASLNPQDHYKVDANQELFALGVSKIGGAFFQAIPTSGSFSRSAVNSESGAKTNMASIITALFIALTLLFFTPLFYSLPNAILASVILLSIVNLFDIQEAIHLWKTHRGDFAMMILTFLITLFFGIEEGVLAGVILSIMVVMYRISQPHIAVLGNIPNTEYYRNIHRFPDAIQLPDCTIIRFDSQLFFANTLYFKDFIEDLVNEDTLALKGLILDASSINEIDSSGLKALEEINRFLKRKQIKFYIAGIIGPVRDRLFRSGLMDKIGKENHFMYVQDAVECYLQRKNQVQGDWTDKAIQFNKRKNWFKRKFKLLWKRENTNEKQ